MAHVLSGSLQQAVRIAYLSATKEANIHVIPERVYVGKGCISNTRGRVAIMKQFPNIVTTTAEYTEPMPRNSPELTSVLIHPRIYRWISLHRTGKSHQLAHGDALRDESAERRDLW
jgi:hypothetical protein